MIKFIVKANIHMFRVMCFLVLVCVPLFASASIQLAIDELLIKAAADVRADRLMKPVSNNAVDRYRAVLFLDKTNQRAALGLRKVVERYIQLAESQKAKGDYKSARNFIASAEVVNGKAAKLTAIRNSINKAERISRVVVSLPKIAPDSQKVNSLQAIFILNKAGLSARNAAIKSQLSALASRVQESKEYVLIYARNDAEGRWIYQQMRKASPKYRLRGDIKRHKKPRVVLEAPLD